MTAAPYLTLISARQLAEDIPVPPVVIHGQARNYKIDEQVINDDLPLLAHLASPPANDDPVKDNMEMPVPKASAVPLPMLSEGEAMLGFMQALAARGMPSWAQALAKGWLARRSSPAAMKRGREIFEFLKRRHVKLLMRIDPAHRLEMALYPHQVWPASMQGYLARPGGGIASLRTLQSRDRQDPDVAQPTISIASRALKRRIGQASAALFPVPYLAVS